jgi:tetratricopeptide (TPR) repeat protein
LVDSVDEFARLLEKLPRGIGGSIELLMMQLDEVTRHSLRLAAIPHQFDLEIFRLLQPSLAAETAAQIVAGLRELSLVQTAGEAYQLHDAARAYLFASWLEPQTTPEFRQVSTRLAAHFCTAAKVASGEARLVSEREAMFHLMGSDENAGFSKFEAMCRRERYQLRLHACATSIALVREYLPILSARNRLWLRYHEAKLIFDLRHYSDAEKALAALADDAGGDMALKVRVLFRLASVVRELGDVARAEALYRQGLALAEHNSVAQDQRLKIMEGLAALYTAIDRPSEARSMLDSAVNIAVAERDESTLAVCYNLLGNLDRRIGMLTEAIQAFERSLDYLARTPEGVRPSQVYSNIGLAYADQTDWPKAREYLETAVYTALEAGDGNSQAIALSNLGRIYLNLGLREKAEEAAESAIRLFQEGHNWLAAAQTNLGMARVLWREAKPGEAKARFVRAAQLFRQAGAYDQSVDCDVEYNSLDRQARVSKWVNVLVGLGLILFPVILLVGMFALLLAWGPQHP